ncbi:MAG: APC family permease [Actinomycetota bacterium]|nr:APC family permease [Actinomycetota bacterium]
MASVAGEAPYQERDLFVRKATGLVRGWSVRDAFIYSAISINFVTLGLYAFSFVYAIPRGSLFWAAILSGAYLVFQAITYASLIAAMPRAGGDYVWISRTLGGGIGFVLAACGWWFILWHWVPIYANILNIMVLGPLSAIIGWDRGVGFWASHNGVFTASMIVALMASLLVAVGIRAYARFQRFCFYGGCVGLLVMFLLLIVHSKADFISSFNSQAHDVYHTQGDAYAATAKAGAGDYASLGSFNFKAIVLLIPFLFFFNLWSNWGATLYGEVRGASDFRKNIYAMGGALLATTAVAAIFLALFAHTFGWTWYHSSNAAYWLGTGPLGVFPYPGTLVAFFTGNAALQFIIVGLLSLWFFGWVGTVFLSSTRVVFAAAFDRVLPEVAAKVSSNGVPYVALALMLIPSIPISYFYAYNTKFSSWTFDATVVIAITFLGSAVSAAILPWRRRDIYNASPIAKYKVAGVPLITVAAAGFTAILVFALVKWFQDEVYAVNFRNSEYYMAALYGSAIAIYLASWLYRRQQGMNLKMVYGEIPAE